MPDDKTCFVISPIGEDGSPTRDRSDQILQFIVRPVAEGCGYDVLRADEMSEPGMITSQVIQHIVVDEMVVADLTDWNPNVFYELALRHALRKPAVHLIQSGQKIPFDVAGARTIQVDHTNLPSVETCKNELERQIRAVESNPNLVDNPISVSVELQSLRQSDNPLEKSNAQILSAVQELRVTLLDRTGYAAVDRTAIRAALMAMDGLQQCVVDMSAIKSHDRYVVDSLSRLRNLLNQELSPSLLHLAEAAIVPIPGRPRGTHPSVAPTLTASGGPPIVVVDDTAAQPEEETPE